MSSDLFGGGSKQTGQQVVEQKTEPWAAQQPYLTEGFEKAKTDVLNSPVQTYPNSTVIPFSPQSQVALAATQERAMQGSPVQTAGNQAMLDTIGGNYLMAENPYFQQAVDAASRGAVRNFQTAVQPGVDSTFSSGGRYGSGMHKTAMETAYDTLGQNLSDTAGKLAYQNYGDERSRQMAAAGAAPGYAAQDYNDMTRLLSVGQAYEGQAGANLQDDISRWYADQQASQDALANYMALVAGGQYGGTTTRTAPVYSGGGSGLSTLIQLGQLGMSAYAACSRDWKEDLGPASSYLDGIRKIAVNVWRYKAMPGDAEVHIGPNAEQFQQLFQVGDGKRIHMIDAIGVMMQAVKELLSRLETCEQAIEAART